MDSVTRSTLEASAICREAIQRNLGGVTTTALLGVTLLKPRESQEAEKYLSVEAQQSSRLADCLESANRYLAD